APTCRSIDFIPFRHTLPAMADVGTTLRRAREARRINLNQAALETRIRQNVLETIEENDYTALPPRPFLRGLLRNYAIYLGLDPELILEEYTAETSQPPPLSIEPEILSSEPPPLDIPQRETLSPTNEEPPEPYPYSPYPIPPTPKSNGASEPALPPSFETLFRVAPELETDIVEPIAPLNIPREPPSWQRRIGSTRMPEIVAVVAIAVVLVGLVSVGFTAFQQIRSTLNAVPTTRPSATPTATLKPGSTPTAIPSLAPTSASAALGVAEASGNSSQTVHSLPTFTPTALPTATLNIPPDAYMTLDVQAIGEMYIWVLADNQEVFNGPLRNDERTFNAHGRLFVQVKNLINGR